MKKKYLNIPIESIISANLCLQTTQRTLSQDYKIYSPKLETLTSDKFISIYKTWDTKKKEEFAQIIVGKLNLKKAKSFFDKKLEEKHEQ